MTQIYGLPKPLDLPTFEAALANLERVPELLYRGLEYGAYKTSAYRDAEFPEKRLDPGLSASMLRAHAIEFLQKEGLDARPDKCHWKFNDLPFLGISFYFNGYHVRVLKGPDGVMPGCGRSTRKKRFYRQVANSYLIGTTIMRSTANLIVLWDFAQGYSLCQLWLALPANGGERPKDVSAYWCEPLTHPAEQSVPVTQPTPTDDGLDDMIKTKDVAAGQAKRSSGAR